MYYKQFEEDPGDMDETKKQWIIGYFKEEHKYSVIPVEWLVSTVVNGVTSSFCKWPPHRVTTMMLMKGGKTSEKWKSYPIHMKPLLLKKFRYTSEFENNEDILRRGKRLKIDNKKNTRLLDFNDTDYKALCGAVESSLNYISPSTLQLIGDNFEDDTAASQYKRPSKLQLINENFENDTAACQ
ncbi:DUF4806 domain-containing protein, partial [Aphis craccivora]